MAKKKTEESSDKTAFDKLSVKHKEFVIAYLKTLNATKSYMKAYPNSKYNSAGVNGHKLLENAKIKVALKEHYDALWESKEDLIGETFNKLLNMTNFDISDYIDEQGNIDLALLKSDNSFPITEIKKVTRETKFGIDVVESIKTVDKLKAISELTRLLGMIQEKVEHTGTIEIIPAERPKD